MAESRVEAALNGETFEPLSRVESILLGEEVDPQSVVEVLLNNMVNPPEEESEP